MIHFYVRETTQRDQAWVREFIIDRWGDELVVVHEVEYYPHKLRGFVAEDDHSDLLGLATFVFQNSMCELVSLDSLQEGEGIGTALLKAVADQASRCGCSRLWCMTTNDNLPALEFYQKRGFRIVAVHPGAVDKARKIKPSIPLYGIESIPIRDEIELELQLGYLTWKQTSFYLRV